MIFLVTIHFYHNFKVVLDLKIYIQNFSRLLILQITSFFEIKFKHRILIMMY